jgi:hypothetical protein
MTGWYQRKRASAVSVLALSLVVGTLLRLFRIHFSFSGDELAIVGISCNQTIAEVIDVYVRDVHPPLYGVLLHYWMVLLSSEAGKLVDQYSVVSIAGGLYQVLSDPVLRKQMVVAR